MREIKFRAWFAKERKMVDVKRLDIHGGIISPSYQTVYAETDFEKGGWYTKLKESTKRNTSLPNSSEQIKRVSLMQYTGFKDCEGVEVYEDDIIELTLNFYDEDSCTSEQKVANGLVMFDSGQWHVRVRSLGAGTNLFGQDSRKVRVVGNIHESPETLKEESE